MRNPPTTSDDTQDAVFIFHVVVAVTAVAWPFLTMLVGFMVGSLVAWGAVFTADRKLAASRKKAAETPGASIVHQRYVVRCARRFFWVRMISIAVVACFLKQPFGIVYLLACVAVSVAEVVLENSKLGDMDGKAPNQ